MRKFNSEKFNKTKKNIQKYLFYQTFEVYSQLVDENKRKDIKKKEPINLLNSNEIHFINSFQKPAILRRRIKKLKNFNLNSRSKRISVKRSDHAKKRKRGKNCKFLQTKLYDENFNFEKWFN